MNRPVIIFSRNNLKRAIDRSGRTITYVSREIGHTSTTRVYRYLSGSMTPSTDMVGRLAAILECDVDELFETSE